MDCEIAIVGGGPAAMSAAIYAARAERSVKVIERDMVGGQSALTHDIANYPGFPDGVNGQDLAEAMKKQSERFGAEFVTGEAKGLAREAGGFRVDLPDGISLLARVVIIGSGSDPRKLGVEGEDALRGRGVSYCGTCDAPFFREKRVVVVGGGDSALKEALHLAKFASHVTIVHRRDALRGEKFYQKQIFEHEKINVRWNTVVEQINGEKKVESVTLRNVEDQSEETFETDGVFIFIGTTPNTAFCCDLLPADCGEHIRTDLDMKTEVDGLLHHALSQE
jgi:thioredoxin reductase (NADPH)